MGHRYLTPMRWGDMDAQAHVNNSAFVDYLQEARVDFLLQGPDLMRRLLQTGVLVVQHQVEYLGPVVAHAGELRIDLWAESVGGARFVLGYEAHDGDRLVLRARTTGAPYDLAGTGLRRLTTEERAIFAAAVEPGHESLPDLPRPRWSVGGHTYPVRVRWSDLDSYGHANNVRFYDYVQDGRVAMIAELGLGLGDDASATDGPWVVVRQDLDYRRPLDFRPEPYRVRTVVTDLGSRSIRLAARIDDPADGAVFAEARTIVVGPRPLTAVQRSALARFRPG